jgi:hypothetical protein
MISRSKQKNFSKVRLDQAAISNGKISQAGEIQEVEREKYDQRKDLRMKLKYLS